MLVNHPDVFIQDNPEIKTMTSQTTERLSVNWHLLLLFHFYQVYRKIGTLLEKKTHFVCCEMMERISKENSAKFLLLKQNLPKYVLWEAKSAFY